jgi:hypothetical protein
MPIDDVGTHISGPKVVTTQWIPVTVLIGSHQGDHIGRANGGKERGCVFVFGAAVLDGRYLGFRSHDRSHRMLLLVTTTPPFRRRP